MTQHDDDYMVEAEFARSLGLDPDTIVLGSMTVEVRDKMPPIVKYEGFLICTLDQIREAFEAGKR